MSLSPIANLSIHRMFTSVIILILFTILKYLIFCFFRDGECREYSGIEADQWRKKCLMQQDALLRSRGVDIGEIVVMVDCRPLIGMSRTDSGAVAKVRRLFTIIICSIVLSLVSSSSVFLLVAIFF